MIQAECADNRDQNCIQLLNTRGDEESTRFERTIGVIQFCHFRISPQITKMIKVHIPRKTGPNAISWASNIV